jgi:lysophospholipase L1-like esterase
MQRERSGLVLAAALVAVASAGQTAAPQAPAASGGFPGQYAPPPADRKFPAWPKGCVRFEGEERASCLDAVASDFGGFYRYAGANAALAPRKPGETRVVFFGDSITDNWSKPEYGGFFPGKPYVNRGIGGQTTAQMLVRFRHDVIALRPKVVVILAGTNDIAGNTGPMSDEEIQGNLESMALLAEAHDIEVVFSSILPVSAYHTAPNGVPQTIQRPMTRIRAINDWMKKYAKDEDHVYLDYFSAMTDSTGHLRAELSGDDLHPNAAGYAIMGPLADRAVKEALR